MPSDADHPAPSPFADTVPEVYAELKQLARRFLMQERRGHTLQPTALVHEAFVRLAARSETASWDRARLLRSAARAMRHVLVDHARTRRTLKRGGAGSREPLDETLLLTEERCGDVLAVHEALARLESIDPELAAIVELRFFGGLSEEDASVALGVSSRTVRRGWSAARLWLRHDLRDGE